MNRPLFSRQALVRSLPFAVFIGLLALRGALEGHFDTRWLYAVQVGGTAAVLVVLLKDYGELRGPATAWHPAPPWVVTIAVGLAVFGLWVTLDAPWMRVGESVASFVPIDADGQLQWPLIALRLTGAVIVVPLMEELFWRSFLMRWIDRRDFLGLLPRDASLLALVASSAVFALAHDLWLAGFLAGLGFGALYRWTGQIWHAIAAHAVANLALGVWVVHGRAWGYW